MIYQFFRTVLFERPTKKKSFTELAKVANAKGDSITAKCEKAQDSEKNRKTLNHIIGIERWCQSRLTVALGDAFVQDEYDGYRPAREASWTELKQLFAETRAETVAIAQRLGEAGVSAETTIHHNDFGEMTPKAWLRYLTFHGNTESMRLK